MEFFLGPLLRPLFWLFALTLAVWAVRVLLPRHIAQLLTTDLRSLLRRK